MRSLRSIASTTLGVLVMAACGSSSSTGSDASAAGGDDGGAEATGDSPGMTREGGDATEAAAPPQDAGDAGNASDGTSSTVDSSDAPGDAPPPPCPDLSGAYSVTAVQGQGCGNSFGMSAPQCIVPSQQAMCDVHFSSVVDAGNAALNGTASLGNDGSFSGAAITEGTLARTGCTGTWTAATSTLRVDCGGVDSGQACVLDLMRTGSNCP